MNLKRLLDESRIEVVEKSELDFEWAMEDLRVSRENFESGNFEWALSICYNGVLRAGMNLMNFFGYRAKGREHHKNVFLFLEEFEELVELVKYFDRIRRKRNGFIYGNSERVSKGEAEEVLRKAKTFVLKIRTIVSKSRTEVKNE